ncbi:MAG: NAD(P)-binding domain-containing protein [Acidimicrobiales bacterium]
MYVVALLVVGAGPYGVAVAAQAIERGVDTVVVGHPMSFWTDHMPEGMFLRSGTDWHLDASGVDTFEAFIEDSGLSSAYIDPLPIGVFRQYAAWFQTQKQVSVDNRLVSRLERNDDAFVASLDDGTQIAAEVVVAAPGAAYFRQFPEWASLLPEGVSAHTCDLVRFKELAGARVLVVGGRQSAYEWAALLGEHGVERVDVVHRHDMPRFERVSWKFVDPYMAATMGRRGWWRSLSATEQGVIARKFWQVGRLSLEWWLTPRLADERIRSWPCTHVVQTAVGDGGTVSVTLSSGDRLTFDRLVFATGYKADLPRVPYLNGLAGSLEVVDGFPVLDEAFQSSIAGLYIVGFASTRDFGPFFGFTKGCPAAAKLIVDDLLGRM